MEEKIRNCLHCGEEVTGNRKKKFCDSKCRTRYFSLKRYLRLKDDPAYKAYRKRYYRTWIEKNREHFNEKMREVSRRWQAENRSKIREGKNGDM